MSLRSYREQVELEELGDQRSEEEKQADRERVQRIIREQDAWLKSRSAGGHPARQ